MKKTSKEKAKAREKEEKFNWIQGKFVICTQDTDTSRIIYIKLCGINSIEPVIVDGEWVEQCYFNTYKDCRYTTWMGAHELLEFVNNDLGYLKCKKPQ